MFIRFLTGLVVPCLGYRSALVGHLALHRGTKSSEKRAFATWLRPAQNEERKMHIRHSFFRVRTFLCREVLFRCFYGVSRQQYLPEVHYFYLGRLDRGFQHGGADGFPHAEFQGRHFDGRNTNIVVHR